MKEDVGTEKEDDDRTESEISSDEQGCITKCYTVFKLEP
jgi:hypothetical protein